MPQNFLVQKKFRFRNISGRNNSGKIVVRFRKGFFLKKKSNLVDSKRFFLNQSGRIIKFCFNFQKTAFLALVYYSKFGLFSYVLSSSNCSLGYKISNLSVEYKDDNVNNFNYKYGDSSILKFFNLGSLVFNIGFNSYSGGLFARAAGSFGYLFRKIRLKGGKEFAGIKLSSGTLVYLPLSASATFGVCSNLMNLDYGNFGARALRIFGRRPRVRGVAMNPVDHPHGGGEGKTSGGRVSVSLWGNLAKGGKTLTFKKKKKRLLFISKLQQNVSLGC